MAYNEKKKRVTHARRRFSESQYRVIEVQGSNLDWLVWTTGIELSGKRYLRTEIEPTRSDKKQSRAKTESDSSVGPAGLGEGTRLRNSDGMCRVRILRA
jgi:hypothetical protein